MRTIKGGLNHIIKINPIDKENPLKQLFDNSSCAVGITPNKDGSCFNDGNTKQIIKYFEKDDVKKDEVFDKLKKITNCNTNKCISEAPIISEIIGPENANIHKQTRIKVEAPLDKSIWLNDRNIENILNQMENLFNDANNKFLHIPFAMRDFQTVNKGKSELANVNFVEEIKVKKIKTFGVIFNDDISSGNGTHWTAMFGDFRNEKIYTIEYFNSAGDTGSQAYKIIIPWMEETAKKIQKELKDVKVEVKDICKIKHQDDNSSCGPYSLYYIIARLYNVPYSYFEASRIPDSTMWAFKSVLFTDEK